MKKLLFVLFLAALGGSIGVYVWWSHSTRRPTFRTTQVTRNNLLTSVSATGSVEPMEIIDVGAQIVGIIKKFGPDADRPGKSIDYRSHVKQGAMLAQLDDLPHRAEQKKAIATVNLAKGELARARARLKQADSEFHRAEKLRDTNSASEYETAVANFDMAQADISTAEAKLEQSLAMQEQAEINLAYTIIKSPVDGVVIDRRVNVGQTVVAGLNAPSLFLMAKDLSCMLVWSAVNEADIGDIHVGQSVRFKVDAYRDRTFTGKVSQIRLNASMLQNVVTYGVVVDVDNRDGILLPYMTARLQFEVARRSNVVLVSNQALRWRPTWDEVSPSIRDDLKAQLAGKPRAEDDPDASGEESEEKVDLGSPTVWTLAEDGFVRPIKVQIGLSDGIDTEITSANLEPGATVVINVVREAKADFVRVSFCKSRRSKTVESPGMALIELSHICKTYRLGDVDLPVLRDVSLTIERGEFVALMGASGSGKTTPHEPAGVHGPGHVGFLSFRGRRGNASLRDAVGATSRESHRFRLPEFQSASPRHGLGQRAHAGRLLDGRVFPSPGTAAEPGTVGHGGVGGAAGPLAQHALRRRTTTRGHRPLAGQPAHHAVGRQADGQFGFADGQGDSPTVPPLERGERDHAAPGDPRRRGGPSRGPGDSHFRRADPGGFSRAGAVARGGCGGPSSPCQAARAPCSAHAARRCRRNADHAAGAATQHHAYDPDDAGCHHRRRCRHRHDGDQPRGVEGDPGHCHQHGRQHGGGDPRRPAARIAAVR